MDIRDDDALKTSLDALEIPEEFARYHAITDAQLISLLDEWRSNVQNALADLRILLQARELLSVNEKAKVISVLAPLDGHDPWMLGSTREQAQGKLSYCPLETWDFTDCGVQTCYRGSLLQRPL